MSGEKTEAINRQERLEEILLGYVEAAESGNRPDRAEFVANHPEFAKDIGEFLADYEKVNDIAAPLRPPQPAVGIESIREVLRTRNRAAHLRSTEAPGAPRELTPPTELGQLGDYRLIREIGRGGMGVVYEAEQISLHRLVALKILPFAGGVDSRQLQRFRNEAQAAAHLHHSHIVPVFAVGSERGVHFYAMQHIQGQSVAALIENRLAGGSGDMLPNKSVADAKPVSGLSQTAAAVSTEKTVRPNRYFKFAATLGQNVAEALEYAHQMGVVHRDIKPANLLLDARSHVWITDFGLAQFHSQVGLTISGEVLGTLRYVSPEQAMAKRGLVDHRTDIYSLGATLYELLTLRPVFDGKDRHALLHQIGFEEPIPPRLVDPSIPVELETILLKSLAKSPLERYSSAQEFADDLQRFLDDKPIMAKRPGLVERARKWGRRHPSFVVAALLLLLFGTIGFAVATVLISAEQRQTKHAYDKLAQEERQTKKAYEELAEQERKAQAAYEAEARQRTIAERDFVQAQRAIDLVIQFSEGELAHSPDQQDVRRRLLMTVLDYYEDFLAEHADDPAAQAELSAGRERVAIILSELSTLRRNTLIAMLTNSAIQKELDLDADQKSHIERFLAGQLKQMFEAKIGPKDKGPRLVERPAESAAIEKMLAETLRVVQKQRFDEIALQVQQQGRYGFSDPKIVASLQITSGQRERIRRIQNDAHKAWADHLFGEQKIANPDGFWTDLQSRILAVLEPGQLQGWRKMIGAPVAIELREGYPWDGRNVVLQRIQPTLQMLNFAGAVSVLHGRGDFTGSGFGHKIFADDKQYYSWRGKEIPRTVFEIAVTGEPLNAEELRVTLAKDFPSSPAKIKLDDSRWTVLFRADDPSIWNTDSPNPARFAIPVENAPNKIRYLRLTRTDNGETMIIPMSHAQLTAPPQANRDQSFHWNGTASEALGARHLGIAQGAPFSMREGPPRKNFDGGLLKGPPPKSPPP